MDSLYIEGFGISTFRSFGDENQIVGPLKKFNIIIGENNSGKSNVTRYVSRVLQAQLSSNRPIQFNDRDRPQKSRRYPYEIIPILFKVTDQLVDNFLQRAPNKENLKSTFLEFVTYIRPSAPDGYVWLPIGANNKIGDYESFVDPAILQSTHPFYRLLRSLWTESTGTVGGDHRHWLEGLFTHLTNLCKKSFKVKTIPAGRKIESCLAEYADEFGAPSDTAKKFIEELARFEKPIYTKVADKVKWAKIQNFVRRVMKDDSIKIEIPSTHDTINFDWNGNFLPIEDLGTGVYQAILLAAHATILEGYVICIEEPELHFHPELQRQIMSYLDDETSNQYFITTHSAQIMDAVDAYVISVRLDRGNSKIELPMSSQDRREICHRLGYRPSDLLQSNCLIWIEGPSDRIYLNHWIKIADSKLQEGWHYSFAMYGGRVLSNFSADEDDPRADEFVQLLPINRFPSIVIDSDIKVQGKEINATKKRIVGEVQKQGGYCWVTKGREIENYVSHELRKSGIGSVHKKYKKPAKSSSEETQWDDPLAYLIADGTLIDEGLDKVGIAEKIVDLGPKLDQLDLGERVRELVAFVHRANNLAL